MTTTVASVDATTPRRTDFWVIWSIALAATTGAGLMATTTMTPGSTPSVWLVATIAWAWLSMSWRGGLVPEVDRPLVLTLIWLALVGVLVSAVVGVGPMDTLRSAVGVPLQAWVMAGLSQVLRAKVKSPIHPPVPDASPWRADWIRRWAPISGRDFLVFGAAALVSATLGLAVGAVPGISFATMPLAQAVPWVVHMVNIATVGGITAMLTFGTWTKDDRNHPWVRLVLLFVAGSGVLIWVHASGAITMAWLQLVPAIIVAMTCRVWATSLFCMLLGLVSVMLSPRLNEITDRSGPVPVATVMDLVAGGVVIVSLMLSFLEARRAQLVADLDRERARTAQHLAAMETVFEGMHDGVIVVNDDLSLLFHNTAATDLLGRPFPVDQPLDWARHFRLVDLDNSPIRNADLVTAEHVVVPLADSRRVLKMRTLRLPEFNGNEPLMTVLTDVTEQHDRIHELSGFAGVVAHDLRAPLTSLEGWLELAEETLRSKNPDPTKVAAMLARARASDNRMRQLIDDWLAYTVSRQGELSMATFPLATPLNAVLTTLAESGPHRFSVEVPHSVHADIATVRQVFANVLGNASKFTRPGETPRIAVRSTPVEGGFIQVEVEDHGIGIPAGQEDAIFEEYNRGSGAATKKEGFGLGLALCRRIVDRHGGRISARTNEFGGATVTFTLPAAQPERTQTPSVDDTENDDNEVNGTELANAQH